MSLTPARFASPHLRDDREKHEPQHSLQRTADRASLESVFSPSLAQEWLWIKKVHGDPYLFPWVLDEPFVRSKTQGWPARHWKVKLDAVSGQSWPVEGTVPHGTCSSVPTGSQHYLHPAWHRTSTPWAGVTALPYRSKGLLHRDIWGCN